MKVLITGIAGFIGSHFASKLLQANIQIAGIDNLNNYYDVSLKHARLDNIGRENFPFYQIDIADYEAVNKVFLQEKPDVVIHLAAQAGVRHSIKVPHSYIHSNIVGYLNILECCRYFHVEHLIYASSSSVYGANKAQPFSTADPVDHPISLYAATKKSNELMAHSYSALYNIPTTGLRFFTVYGPWGRPDMALFKFTRGILEEGEVDVYNYGKMARDFTYVSDIVEAIYRLLGHKPAPNANWDPYHPNPSDSFAPYKIYNIGNNQPVNILEFIEAIETKLGKKCIKNFKDLQPGDVPKTFANVDDLYRQINFKPSVTITEGVNKFIDWYLSYYNISKGC
ncbi:NAD-dependent epimerase [Staphylococcus arlettae]|uniref:NAD-dependent epimerase n=1 Tax=Staphylococcus arlettae TaxID=29378 RepID=UPI000D1BBC04|nr:NAD-dependent epimerase [Staphylococcus arlettae]PTH23260.1 protein CapI [Staphylococcus arlettae]PTH51453.1 protein CapI [Staphylococcus arlettae]PTH51702.1 protein CapI [Staphylococcus arlettae]